MKEFAKAANRNDVTGDELKMVGIGDEEVVLAEVGGDVVAFNNVCPTRGAIWWTVSWTGKRSNASATGAGSTSGPARY